MNWNIIINQWKKDYNVKILLPPSESSISAAQEELRIIPSSLLEMYHHCNGMSFRSFLLYPVFDPDRPKDTWDSIQRINEKIRVHPDYAEVIGDDFIVLARIDSANLAIMNKNEQTIWFEDEIEFHQTNLTLEQFISFSLQEQKEG